MTLDMPKVLSVREQVQKALLKAGYQDSKLEAVVFAIVETQIAAALHKICKSEILADMLMHTKKDD